MITVEQAEREMAALEAELEALYAKQARLNDLKAFVDLGRRLASKNGSAVKLAPEVTTSQPLPVSEPVTEIGPTEAAEKAFKIKNPMHLDEAIKMMHGQGWKITGDKNKDRNNAWSALHRSKKFRNRGGNIWELIG